MKQLYLKAMGKINLGLDVLGKLDNGYHQVRMVMQMVNMYDKVTLTILEEPGIQVSTNLFFLPTDENNLVYKAARLLMDEFHIKKGLQIDLYKFIPVAAGMAGGSSDAASVLYGVNRLFGLGLTRKQLMERGVQIGADVPYCVMRRTALAEGIGEALTPLASMPPCAILLAKPGISVSTKAVYERLDMQAVVSHPPIDDTIEALRNRDLQALAASMGNVLESVTISHYPEIEKIKEDMKEAGALNAMMSGSGPTVFGIFEEKEKALATARFLRERGVAKQIYVTEPFVHNGMEKEGK